MSWVWEPVQSICTIRQHVYKTNTAYRRYLAPFPSCHKTMTISNKCILKGHWIHHTGTQQMEIKEIPLNKNNKYILNTVKCKQSIINLNKDSY